MSSGRRVSGSQTSPNGFSGNSTHGEIYGLACKVMLIGDSGVGKTCLLVRFKDNTFLSGSFISTVGIDFRNKVVDVDGTKVKLQIWDTAGQERFRSITRAYYRDAQVHGIDDGTEQLKVEALLLLYDVTNRSSFENIRAWLAEINEYAQDDVVIMLLGNKADVANERMVQMVEGNQLAKEYNIAFMETSAKTGLNVDLAFTAVARNLKARKASTTSDANFNMAEYLEQKKQKESCCT